MTGKRMARRNNDFAAKVGARIRCLRLERGYSLRKLANVAKCCAWTTSLIERGRSSIQMEILRKLAQALQVEPVDLLNHDPENDDMGYIVEKMRQDPETRKLIKEQLEAWDVMAAKAE